MSKNLPKISPTAPDCANLLKFSKLRYPDDTRTDFSSSPPNPKQIVDALAPSSKTRFILSSFSKAFFVEALPRMAGMGK